MDNRRVVLKPTHVAVRERRRRRLVFSFHIFLTAILIAILSYVSSVPFLTINEVRVEGNRVTSERDIARVVAQQLDGNYLYLFSKSNTLLYPKDTIRQTLLEEFPRFESVKISRNSLTTVNVVVEERVGEYLWCGFTVADITIDTNTCYFIDTEGYIFGIAPYFSGGAYLKFFGAEILHEGETIIGAHVTNSERFISLIRMLDGVKRLGFDPESLVIEKDGVYKIILAKVSTAQQTQAHIMFNDKTPVSTLLENLEAALQAVQFKNSLDESPQTLFYIDLRFENKVYYKFNPTVGTF